MHRNNKEIQIKLNEIRNENIPIEELTFFDSCMGSGHILVYAFDVFFEIYKELGYLEKEIPELILKNNIFGLDIDDRAYQLAYFAVLMKARKYDRRIFKKNIVPNVYSIQESGNITEDVINFIRKHDESIINDIIYLKKIFKSGKEFGSLIQVKNIDFNRLKKSLKAIIDKSKSTLTDINIANVINNDLNALINQAELLSNKYYLVVTNPPYMNKLEKSFKDFAKEYYDSYSKDLFSMFIYRNFDFCKENGYCSFITPFNWMFIPRFNDLRSFIIHNKTISSLIQLEYNAFTEVAMVPVATFVFCNNHLPNYEYNGTFFKLSEFKGGMDVQKEKVLDAINNKDLNYVFYSNSRKFLNIPGTPIAYWVSDKVSLIFQNSDNMKKYINSFSGIISGNNGKFLRYWYEVSSKKISFYKENMNDVDLKNSYWIPYNKGGDYRKWYGNLEYVIDWSNGPNDKKRGKAQMSDFYLKKFVTWSRISLTFSARYVPSGCLWDINGCGIFGEKYLYYIQALLCSKVGLVFFKIINPTLGFQVEDMFNFPIIFRENYHDDINKLVKRNIEIAKLDWDSFETSWDFKIHPLLTSESNLIKSCFDNWVNFQERAVLELKTNECRINEIFIDIYDLSDELDPNVSNEDITLYVPDKEKDIKSFISYAVGCMFGRYSLDQEGLQFAGGDFNISNYNRFTPDDDNIIPILDTEYFEDDITGRFVEFVKVCFGESTLEENLDFIANALNKKGKTSREIIRNYFLTEFFKDHARIYKKCPIYWQFDSGRQNAFKCLIYMHRYEPELVARVRTDYLHKTQKAIEQNLAHCDNIIANSTNKSEISKATKDKSKYIKQLDEIRNYDEALSHIANQHIDVNLDDGVKVNYAKFQKVEISKEGEKTKKINLLKNI